MIPLICTDTVPEHERVDWFADTVGRLIAPVRLSCPDPGMFRARVGTLDFGATAFSLFDHTPLRFFRTPSLIRLHDPEHYQLALVTAGSAILTQRRRTVSVTAGDWVLFDTSHEYETETTDRNGLRHLLLRLPHHSVPLPPDRIDALLATRLGGGGIGEVLRGHLLSIARHGGRLRAGDTERLNAVTRDLAVAFLAHHLDRQRTLPDEAHRTSLLTRIDYFIDMNLADPRLTPAAIADHHRVSVRTLHALFESRRTTVAATIRRRRLERCRRDLSDPELASRRIADIAAHWGFTNPSVFSRTFRATYGATPGTYRRKELPTQPRDPRRRHGHGGRTPDGSH
ncbi:helix-turn-helix domain-containing protein [Streptomyces tsukubensis]|uniref:AraC-like ligand-binding domain-containing protein n=1 Tax=Streptomyces tsukubensis TaxID=83656 RepID=UPI0036B8E88A